MSHKKKEIKKPYDTELHIFNSFEEASEYEAKQLAAFSGINHLANATELIKRIYYKELLLENDLTIEFK